MAASVRAGLAKSIEAAFRALGEDRVLAGANLIERVRSGPIAPQVFGAYTELVEAIFADDSNTAQAIADEMCATDFGGVSELRVITLTEQHLGK